MFSSCLCLFPLLGTSFTNPLPHNSNSHPSSHPLFILQSQFRCSGIDPNSNNFSFGNSPICFINSLSLFSLNVCMLSYIYVYLSFHFLKGIYYILKFICLLTVCHPPPEYMFPEIKNFVHLTTMSPEPPQCLAPIRVSINTY